MSDEKPTQERKWESVDTDWYDDQWKKMEDSGQNPHGEADFVSRFSPSSVLDAGCGTGRVAIELAKRGARVSGVDVDEPFIAKAKRNAPELDFHLGDLATITLEDQFDVVVLAGNVMIFVAPGTEAQVVANMARHLAPGGRLISGFQLGRGLSVETYNEAAIAAGLTLAEHWASWDGDRPTPASKYAVLVHVGAADSGEASS